MHRPLKTFSLVMILTQLKALANYLKTKCLESTPAQVHTCIKAKGGHKYQDILKFTTFFSDTSLSANCNCAYDLLY